MKFEYIFDQFVALGPKAYGGVLSSAYKNEGVNGEIVKIKGYSSILPFKEFQKGLNSNYKIELKHKKWQRKLEESTIIISDEGYTLSVTEGKRNIIYDKNNNFISTEPLRIFERYD